MIEKHDTNSFLFQESKEVKEKERGTENYNFYKKYLDKQIKEMKEKLHELITDEALIQTWKEDQLDSVLNIYRQCAVEIEEKEH